VSPKRLDLVWSRHVNNLDDKGGDNDVWSLQGKGTLTRQ